MAELYGETVLARCELKSPEGQRDKRFSCALTKTKLVVTRWGKEKVFPVNQLLNAESGWRLTPWLIAVALAVAALGAIALYVGNHWQEHYDGPSHARMDYDPDRDPVMIDARKTGDDISTTGTAVIVVGVVLFLAGLRRRPYLLLAQSNGNTVFRLPVTANLTEFDQFVAALKTRLGRSVVDADLDSSDARPKRSRGRKRAAD